MARTIKRYANRKLYDTSAKRYLTLEDIARLVEAGEEIKIIDNRTGNDITSTVLSKAISEMISDGAGKEKAWLVDRLSEMIQKRSEEVVDYVKQGLAVGAKTVKDVEEQLQQRWRQVTKRTDNGTDPNSTEELKTVLQRTIEDSVHYLISRMNLPTRTEIMELNARLDEIEKSLKLKSNHRKGSKKSRASKNDE